MWSTSARGRTNLQNQHQQPVLWWRILFCLGEIVLSFIRFYFTAFSNSPRTENILDTLSITAPPAFLQPFQSFVGKRKDISKQMINTARLVCGRRLYQMYMKLIQIALRFLKYGFSHHLGKSLRSLFFERQKRKTAMLTVAGKLKCCSRHISKV